MARLVELQELIKRIEADDVSFFSFNEDVAKSLVVHYDQLVGCFPIDQYQTFDEFLDAIIVEFTPLIGTFLNTKYFPSLVKLAELFSPKDSPLGDILYAAFFESNYCQTVHKDILWKHLRECDKYWFKFPRAPNKDKVLTECQLEYWKVALDTIPKWYGWNIERQMHDYILDSHRLELEPLKYSWLCRPRVDSRTSYKGDYLRVDKGRFENETVLSLICESIEAYVLEVRSTPDVVLNHSLLFLLEKCPHQHDYSNFNVPERLVLELVHGNFTCLKQVLVDLRVIRNWPECYRNFLLDAFRFAFDGTEFVDTQRFGQGDSFFVDSFEFQYTIGEDPLFDDLKALMSESLRSSHFNINRYVEWLMARPNHFRPEAVTALVKSDMAKNVHLSTIRKHENLLLHFLLKANKEAFEKVVTRVNPRRILQVVRDFVKKEPNCVDITDERARELIRCGAFLHLTGTEDLLKPLDDDDDIVSVCKSICRGEIPDLTRLSFEMITSLLPKMARRRLFEIFERRLDLYLSPRRKAGLDALAASRDWESFDWKSMPIDDLMEDRELRMATLRLIFSNLKRGAKNLSQFGLEELHLFLLLAKAELP